MTGLGRVPAWLLLCVAIPSTATAQPELASPTTSTDAADPAPQLDHSALEMPEPSQSSVVQADTSSESEPTSPEMQEEPPDVIDYEPGQPIPSGYARRRRVRRGLVIPGGIVFGLGYGLSILGAIPKENDKDIDGGWLFLPVFGPLAALVTQRDTCSYAGEGAHCEKATSTIVVLSTLFSMQAAGASLLSWGLLSKRQVLERQSAQSMSIVPTRIGNDGYGVTASGAF